MNWAVVHVIHTQLPHQHKVKLFITEVPESLAATDVRRALTRSGFLFEEFGVPWANHFLCPEPEWSDEVIGSFNSFSGIARVHWDLISPADEMRRLTIRVHTTVASFPNQCYT